MFKKHENSQIYECYLNSGEITEDTDIYKRVEFECAGQKYTVYTIKKRVRKSNIIHLMEDGTIYREQLLPFGHIMCPSRIKASILKLSRPKDEVLMVLFDGKPNFIGLDEDLFVSAKNENKAKSSIYVMTVATFKLFNG